MPVSCLLSGFAFISGSSAQGSRERVSPTAAHTLVLPCRTQLLRAWRTCWNLSGHRGRSGQQGVGAGRNRGRPGCDLESVAEREQLT